MSQLIQNYLKGSDAKPHLRLLAVVELQETNHGETKYFGIFAGCKGKKTIDNDFNTQQLRWDSKPEAKPDWHSEKPLWCVPLKVSADTPYTYELNYSKDPLKNIYQCRKAIVKLYNGKDGKITNWKDYSFLPDKDAEYQELITSCTYFDFNPAFGTAHYISENNTGEGIGIWITDRNMTLPLYNKKLFRLGGVVSEIIDVYKNFNELETWFGVRQPEGGEHAPFFTVDPKNKANANGYDVPVYWKYNGRIDDIVTFDFDKYPVKISTSFNNSDLVSTKIRDEDIDDQSQIAWLGKDATQNKLSLLIADKKTVTGVAGTYLSNNGESTVINYLLYRYTKDSEENRTILCKIKNTTNLIHTWNEKTQKKALSILDTEGAQPIGIVPTIENTVLNSVTVVYDNVNGVNANFSNVYFSGLGSPDISFPLIRNKDLFAKTNHVHRITEPLISLNGVVFESSEGNVADNGSIIILNVKTGKTSPDFNDVVLLDGSFSFKLKNYSQGDELIDKLQVSFQLQKAQRPLFLWQWYKDIDKEDFIEYCYSINKFRIPVQEVKAFGNDLIGKEKLVAPSSLGTLSEGFGERSEPALVIPLLEKQENLIEGLQNAYYLMMSESSNVAQNYRLEMQLEEKDQIGGIDSTATVEAVVLNAAPQQIAKIKTQLLRSPSTDDGIYILARKSNFSIDSGTWEIYTDNALEKGFELSLPSQGIGEAYIKNKINSGGEPEENKAIDYKFSPSAVLQIANEQLNRQYVTPAWNLKNIWGEVGNGSPGLQLIKAKFELLYGLGAQLENKNAFIAELALKLGAIPNPPQNNIVWKESKVQEEAFKSLYMKYRDLYRSWQSRLSVLEVSASELFRPGKFTDGISYFIRREKNLLNEDGSVKQGKGAQFRWPLGLQISPAENDRLYHNPNGLAGGALYPFESLGVYEQLWRDGISKGSSSGEIEQLAFTSLGGYGKQTARFSSDKTVIKSTTSLGRTHFHAVERIGRIGVFWNRAKHVIEYERTVVPSIQFKDEQPELLGRPIVRKVREYIEILEPLRKFPDLDAVSLDGAGSVTGCHFKSIKIPVSSSWGRNVKANGKEIIGWEIPLWNKNADPEIYPFPQVLLELLPPKGAEMKNVLSPLESVEKLHFYTDVRSEAQFIDGNKSVTLKIEANTDKWPLIKHVDYTDAPMVDIHKNARPALGNTPELMDAPLPGPISILPGYERFCFKVKPSEATSSVNGRYVENSEINGKLRVVTMLRSTPKGNKLAEKLPNKPGIETILNQLAFDKNNILSHCANGLERTNTKLLSGIIPAGVTEYVSEAVEKITFSKDQIKAIKGELVKDPQMSHLDTAIWSAANHFEFPTKLLWKKTVESTEGFIAALITNYSLLTDEAIKKVNATIAEADEITDGFIDKLYYEIDGQVVSVRKIIEQLSFEVGSLASEAMGIIEQGVDVIKCFLQQVDTHLSDAEKEILKIKLTIPDEVIDEIKRLLNDKRKSILDEITSNVLLNKLNAEFNLEERINGLFDSILKDIDESEPTEIKELINFSVRKTKELCTKIIEYIKDGDNLSEKVREIVKKESSDLKEGVSTIESKLLEVLKILSSIITVENKNLKDTLKAFSREKKEFLASVNTRLHEIVDYIKGELEAGLKKEFSTILVNNPKSTTAGFNPLFDYFKIADDYIKSIARELSSFFHQLDPDQYKAEFSKYLERYESYKDLEDAIGAQPPNPQNILAAANKFTEELNEDLGTLTGTLLNAYSEVKKTEYAYNDLSDAVNNTLFNYRGVYDELVAPGLGFNRKTIAMLVSTDWENIEQRLTITPVVTKFNQLKENLSSLGIRLPSVSITDKFLAPAREWGETALKNFQNSLLSNYDFTNILKGAGGLNLERLIPGFKMPDAFRNNVKIMHGTDVKNLKAWVKAETNISLPKQEQLFAIGPVSISLDKAATLVGNVKAEIDADSKLEKENYGSLTGSFIIGLQGTELMRFRDAKITCVNDKYDFDLDPSRMEMSGLLQLITDATKHIPAESEDSEETSVFKIDILKAKYQNTDIEIPYGVNASLDIPAITIGGGPTNITNLAFGGYFRMKAFDVEKKTLDFNLGLGFYLGKREAPFIFTAFIFGGGGFIDCSVDYAPSLSNSLNVNFAMSVQASAALAFNAGWIYGSVMVGLGIEVMYVKKAFGPGSRTSVIMFIQFIGHVCVVRIIHVFLVVRLAIAYDGQKMKGTGRIKASMRICRFFTLKVEKDYTHNF